MPFVDMTQYPSLDFLREVAAQYPALLEEVRDGLDYFSPSPEVYIQDPTDIRLHILPVKWQGQWVSQAVFDGDRSAAWRPVCTGEQMERAAPRLKQVADHPLVVNAMYSLSLPGCEITPHTDRVEAIGNVLRVHVGLCCPPGCGLSCGGEVREWQEGGVFMFDSALSEHSAWNRSEMLRVIAIIDIDRQLLEGELVA